MPVWSNRTEYVCSECGLPATSGEWKHFKGSTPNCGEAPNPVKWNSPEGIQAVVDAEERRRYADVDAEPETDAPAEASA